MDEQAAIRIVSSPESAETELLELFVDVDVDSELREAALNHPGVSDDAVRLLLVSAHEGLRARILALTDRTDVLTEWASALDPEDRGLVAFNPSTPASTVQRLARDPEPRVRANAVFNPALPDALVAEMAALDTDDDVREAAETALGTAFGWSLRQGRRWVHEGEVDP